VTVAADSDLAALLGDFRHSVVSLWPLPSFGRTAHGDRMNKTAYTDDLTPEVCRTLLASHEVGRVAFVGDEGDPVVLPVNYLVWGDDIIVRTDGGEAHEHLPLHRAAFEVDRVDEEAHTGWSVLVRGPARDIPEPDEFARPESWEPGEKSRWIAIKIDRVSGRHIVRPHE
jgi:nitroimidazol reductase NimA-like FMN-containing flavoprotein (pyridoxamine 5'-phosphate oxidase superfamily)